MNPLSKISLEANQKLTYEDYDRVKEEVRELMKGQLDQEKLNKAIEIIGNTFKAKDLIRKTLMEVDQEVSKKIVIQLVDDDFQEQEEAFVKIAKILVDKAHFELHLKSQ